VKPEDINVKIPDELMKLAKKAGEDKNINIGYESLKHSGGEWVFKANPKPDWLAKSGNTYECSLELTYWLAANGCINETSNLKLTFPLNETQKQEVIGKVSAMIENIRAKFELDSE
jgi:hypothetical protein